MKLPLALGCLILVGCAPSLNQRMSSQVGVLTAQSATAKFSAPISESKSADGGTPLVWAPKRYASAPTRYVAPRGPTYGGSASGAHALRESSQDKLTLVFDRRGLLQRWQHQHP